MSENHPNVFKYYKFSGTQKMKLVEHLSVERQIGKKMRFMCIVKPFTS
jgi:hypothetical protein